MVTQGTLMVFSSWNLFFSSSGQGGPEQGLWMPRKFEDQLLNGLETIRVQCFTAGVYISHRFVTISFTSMWSELL